MPKKTLVDICIASIVIAVVAAHVAIFAWTDGSVSEKTAALAFVWLYIGVLVALVVEERSE